MVAVLTAFALTGMVGITAVAVDGGLLLLQRREAQAAADAAALAAAADLFKGSANWSNTAKDYVTKYYPTAWQANLASPPIVNSPPQQSANYKGKAGYVEVIVQYNQPGLFSGVFGINSVPITARAVARGSFVSPASAPAVMALDSTPGVNAIDAGNGQVLVVGAGDVISNSNIFTHNNGSIKTDGVIEATGTASGVFNPPATQGVPTTPDPYAFLPAPAKPGNGVVQQTGSKTYDIYPGYFGASNPLSIPNNVTVNVHQESSNGNGGIYYLDGPSASINFAGQTTINVVSGESGGMMFFVGGTSPSWASLTIAGQGTYALPGLSTTTSAYQNYLGFLFMQAQGNTSGMTLGGNASGDSFNGYIYAPDAPLTLNGNATETINHAGLIANTITINGNNDTLQVVYSANTVPKTRIIALVE
jgi:hypothetical protein